MTRYGFLIDHGRCIGCHACTVACKAENEVPIGKFRTWVKTVDHGVYPQVRRSFGVLRCNHCSRAPCVTICPVRALERREDGIVDLDRDACIGCKACMQACPYDAIYLNEETGSAEKCHYCAHRVERDLAPACVVVCPEQAIVAGDLDDPDDPLARRVASEPTEVRRPEKGTGPAVHYVGHDPIVLRPGGAVEPPLYPWGERPPGRPETWPAALAGTDEAVLTWDAGHAPLWGQKVAAYLVTKGIAAGALLVAPLHGRLLGEEVGPAARLAPEATALVGLAATAALLVADLARPTKFLRLLLRPNPRSWLVRGAWVLTASGLVAALAAAFTVAGGHATAAWVRFAGVPVGALLAGYTAFLFAQCEARELWRSPGLLPQLLFQALLLGGLALAPWVDRPRPLVLLAAAGAVGHLAVALLEGGARQPTENARRAAWWLSRLKVAGVPGAATGSILVAAGAAAAFLSPLAGFALAAAGLFVHEIAFVRAAQIPPVS